MDKPHATLRFLAGRLLAWLAAVATAYLLASISSTQSVVASLQGMGVPIPLGIRLSMTSKDILGMAGMLLPLVAFALLIAFLVTALLRRWIRRGAGLLYFLAGAAALVTLHLALHAALGVTPVAIARSPGGLAVQALAGGLGGLSYLFMVLRAARP
jgi:hypothetical protein